MKLHHLSVLFFAIEELEVQVRVRKALLLRVDSHLLVGGAGWGRLADTSDLVLVIAELQLEICDARDHPSISTRLDADDRSDGSRTYTLVLETANLVLFKLLGLALLDTVDHT